MKRLDERGNTTIFIIGSFSMFLIFLLIVGSLGKVFLLKEKSSDNADQASIVATSIIMDHLQIAVEEYDASLTPEEYPILALGPKINLAKTQLGASHPDWSEKEVKTKAINQVLAANLPGNVPLKGFVYSRLSEAEGKIPGAVIGNILANDGVVKDTQVRFVNNRVQVKTSTRFKGFKYDEYLPEEKRYIKQKGSGPELSFANGLGGWSLQIDL